MGCLCQHLHAWPRYVPYFNTEDRAGYCEMADGFLARIFARELRREDLGCNISRENVKACIHPQVQLSWSRSGAL